MLVRQVAVPREVVTSYKRDEGAVQAKAWAVTQAYPEEVVEVRSTNSGWQAIYRCWPQTTD
jgi:hypothetical protein